MQKAKIQELEIIRTMAFLAVVLQHILGAYTRRGTISLKDNILIGLSFGLAKFAVPTFIFLSGVVLFYHYYNNLNYFRFIKKRFIEIILPYAAWSFIYILWNTRDLRFWKPAWVKLFGKDILLGTASYHTWYVFMIFQLFLFLPIIFFAYRSVQTRVKSLRSFIFAFSAFTIVYLAVMQFYAVGKGIPIVETIFVAYRSQNFIFYSFYFILGGICGLYYDRWIKFIKKYFYLSVIGSLLFYAVVEYVLFTKGYKNNRVDLNYMGSLNLRFFFFTVFNILMIHRISLVFSGRAKTFNRVCEFIGKYSFQAYLAHAFVISLVSILTIRYYNILSRPVYYFAFFIVSSAASVLLAYVIAALFKYIIRLFSKINSKQVSDL